MRILRYISVFFGTLLISALSYAQSESSVFSAQYSYGDGAEAFILKQSLIDNLDYDATLQMHASNEVWVLNKAQGARGTVLYRNDTGRVFLRVNPIGGATLYPTPDSMGIPVLLDSKYRFEATPPIISEEDVEPKSIQEWSRRYAYAGNKKPPKDQPNENEITSSLIRFADWPASKTAYKTELITHLDDLMSTELNKDIKQIIVKIGDQPRAAQQDAELTIWVNPALGFAGRPSTEKILAEVYAHRG